MKKRRRTTADALGIPFEELPDDAKARALQAHRGVTLGPNSPLRRAETFDEKKAARSAAGRKRGQAGKSFEDELEIVHGIYLLQRRAKMERIRPNTVWKKGREGWELRLAPGGAPLDFVGTIAGGLAGGLSVVFDAKICDQATYTHQAEQHHQLERLEEHARMGAAAFLLVQCPSLEIAYLIGDPGAWKWLRAGKGIMLRGKREDRDPRLAGTPEGFVHEWPFCRRPSELLTMQTTPQWDWLTVLQQHITLGRPQV